MNCRFSHYDRPQTRLVLSVINIFAAIVGVLVCQRARAIDSSDVPLRLQKIRGEVVATEKVIANLKKEFSELSKERKSLEITIQTLGTEEERLIQKDVALTQEKSALETGVLEAEKRVAERQSLIRERLRGLYTTMTVSSSASFIFTSGGADVERGAVYARSVRTYDEQRFREVRAAVEALTTARAALEQAFQNGQRLREEIKRKRVESESQIKKLQAVLEQIKARRDAAQKSLALLQSEASNLEQLLQSITGGDSPSADSSIVVSPQDSAPPPQESPSQEAPRAGSDERGVETVMHPEGLFGKRARLSAPVRGHIVQGFGKRKVTDFADMIFSKGVEYTTPEGSEVHAVLGGKVAFAGSMPGYDTVVIIDHGLRSYSLYGRLGKAFVAKGDLVKRSDVIGVTSQADAKKRNFYFETRRNGSPVDPSSVLARVAS